MLPHARALTDATLTDAALQTRPAQLAGLHDGVLRYYDDQRILREVSTAEVVRLRWAGDGVSALVRPTSPWMLWLTDGQRLAGKPAGFEEGGQRLRWKHPALGTVSVALEQVSQVRTVRDGDEDVLSLTGNGNNQAESDAVVLDNGDTLTGFVSRATGDGVVLEAGEGNEIVLTWDRVARLVLANPGESATGRGDVVWLVDGSRVRSGAVWIEGDDLYVTPHLASGNPSARRLPITSVSAVDFGASGFRVVELGSLPMEVVKSEDVFGLAYPPRWRGDELRLHAPVAVRFTLGQSGLADGQAGRVAGVVAWPLPARATPELREVLAMGLSVRAGEARERVELVPGTSTAFNMPLRSGTLTFELESGGPGEPGEGVLGRAGLREVLVLWPVPAEPRSENVP